jgi:release factor glutamine methyltransferase
MKTISLSFEGRAFELAVGESFAPTDTTRLLVQCSLPLVNQASKVLDLGCGIGVVALAIANLRSIPKIFLSDVDAKALTTVQANFQKYGQAFDFRLGDIFEPWKGERFDLIVDDVSGVAEPLAKRSRWFQGVPCSSGEDGTALVTQAIREAPAHLHPSGKLVFPIISLSNSQKILDVGRRCFGKVVKAGSKEWPIPPELLAQSELLSELESRSCITLVRKFGMLLGRTDVYVAEDPIDN